MPELQDLTPRQIVAELDKYIVGQAKAKRAVAIALRNRYRREQLPEELRRDIIPKNILMIGPTGVGKTEIARRLAALAGAPFVKVEATKYTEVGYVGRDVESMVRDLAEAAIRMVQRRAPRRRQGSGRTRRGRAHHRRAASRDARRRRRKPSNPFAATLGSIFGNSFGAQAGQQPAAAAGDAAGAAARIGTHPRRSAGRHRARLLRRAADRDRGRRSAAAADRHDRRRRPAAWAAPAT